MVLKITLSEVAGPEIGRRGRREGVDGVIAGRASRRLESAPVVAYAGGEVVVDVDGVRSGPPCVVSRV